MKLDLSFKVEKKFLEKMLERVEGIIKSAEHSGHVGTHFDVMDKEFCLENIITTGRVFDISHIQTGEVKLADVDISTVEENDFVMFYSGVLKKYGYGTKEYFSTYIELSDELIDALIEKKASLIGVDMAGAKKAEDHPRIDQYCADKGVFIIENLSNLDILLKETSRNSFTVYTFPMNWNGFTGLPCRIVAEL